MLLRQFLDKTSCTFTYLIAEDYHCAAAIIDPVLECVELYEQFINEFDLTLHYSIETHTHADHVTASGQLAKQLGCQIVVGEQSQATPVDLRINDQQKLPLGNLEITAIYTPGHTDDSYCYLCEGNLFTGDTLMIRSTGRTDFQSGCAKKAYASITQKLFTLPDNTRVYPAHDYKIMNVSTIGEEKHFNSRLQVHSADDYADMMNHLNLDPPKKMKIAIPANLKCGLMERSHD